MINSIKQECSQLGQYSKRNIFIFLLFMSLVALGQTTPKKGLVTTESIKVENLAVTVTVDSAEDIVSAFKTDDLAEIIKMSSENQTFSFKIICNKKTADNNIKSSMSYKIEGTSKDPDTFLNDIEKIRAAVIKYYNNK